MNFLMNLYPGHQVVNVFVVIAVTVALVSAAAWCVTLFLERYPAVRYRILFSALIAVLASPVLALVFSASGRSFATIPLLEEAEPIAISKNSSPEISLADRSTLSAIANSPTIPTSLAEAPKNSPINISTCCPKPSEPANVDAGSNEAAVYKCPETAAVSPSRVITPTDPFKFIVVVVLFAWLFGTLLLLTRMLRSALFLRRLRRSMQECSSVELTMIFDEAKRLTSARVALKIMVSPLAHTPLAMGLFRPVVVLPVELSREIGREQLRDVLVHEIAHVERRDNLVILLQVIAKTMFWPIMFINLLNRQLTRAREEICDNYVLAGRDALNYGETLLRLAHLACGVEVPCGTVGILHWRGKLEDRIRGLIDSKRNKTVRTNRFVSVGLLIAFLSAATLLCATTILSAHAADLAAKTSEENATSSSQKAKSENVKKERRPPNEAELQEVITLNGKVLDFKNRPVAEAKIFLANRSADEPIQLGQSDSAGNYRFTAPAKSFIRYFNGGPVGVDKTALIAVAPGHGVGITNLEPAERHSFQMPKRQYLSDIHLVSDFPVSGRIVGTDGKPVAGASIKVNEILPLSDLSYEEMRKAVDINGPILSHLRSSQLEGSEKWELPAYSSAWQLVPKVATDQNGNFQIAGLGNNRAIMMRVDGPGILPVIFTVLTRDNVADFATAVRAEFPQSVDMSNFPQNDDGGINHLYDSHPTIKTRQAPTIAGIVRDAKTGKPIPHVRIVVNGRHEGYSDRDGRYRIIRGGDASLVTVSVMPDEKHYLHVIRHVKGGESPGEMNSDFDLSPGVRISGRVVESGTDQPLVSAPHWGCGCSWPGFARAGYAHYYPLSTNTALRGTEVGFPFKDTSNLPENKYNPSISTEIGADGKFQLAVPPGPGVLIVRAQPGMPFMQYEFHESQGIHRLFPYSPLKARLKNDGLPDNDTQALPGFNHPISIAEDPRKHAYRVINPTADMTSLEVKFEVLRGQTRLLRFVNTEGQPIKGVRVHGLFENWYTFNFDASEAEVMGLEEGKPRKLSIFSHDKKYYAITSVSTDDPQPKTIQLERTGSITGRVVDQNGRPVLKALLTHLQKDPSDPSLVEESKRGIIPQVYTDAEGRFEITPLIPGKYYSAEIHIGEWGNQVIGKAFDNLVVTSKEVHDVGGIKIKRPAVENTDGKSVK